MSILIIIISIGFGFGMIATFLMIRILLKRGCHGEFKFCQDCEYKKQVSLSEFNEKFDIPSPKTDIFSDLDEIEV